MKSRQEDFPEKSILRRNIFEQNYKDYVKRISAYKLKGDSKTVVFCKKFGIIKGLCGAYARLFDNAILYDENNYDSFFPYVVNFKNNESINELVEWGIPLDKSLEIIAESIGDINKSSVIMSSIKFSESDKKFKINILNDKIKICYGYEDDYIQIKVQYFVKLLNLYNIKNKENIKFEKCLSKITKKIEVFIRRVFCMVYRYETYFKNSSGLQGAVPYKALDTLKILYGIDTECFSSPLNCYYDNYYSIFYDTDRFFGSKGNFFRDFNPVKGNYEVNPPFVLEILDRVAIKLDKLLENGEDLIFFIILPNWDDTFYCNFFKNNKYTLEFSILKKGEHKYIDGMQHISERTEWSAKADSIWFLMTNIKNLNTDKNIINESFNS